MKLSLYLFLALATTLLLTTCGGSEEEAAGVIKIGNTMPYSGPASAYGTIGKAISAYFDKVNDDGGINGRKIEFISLDDAYSPPKTKEQIRKLVEREKVLLIMGSLGTAANSAVHEYLNRKRVPHLFVSSGATKWGQPEKYPWTMGWQPSYTTESQIFGRYILKEHPDATIGILFQNDDYGKDYLHGLRASLAEKADAMIVAEESYEVTDPTIDAQILRLKASGATLFLNVTTPKFAAQAIKKLDEIEWRPVHLLNGVGNSVGAVLKPAGLERCKGIISMGYFESPETPGIEENPAFQEWSAWMKEYYPEGDPNEALNVYGYLVAQTMAYVLQNAGDDLSRENIMKQAAGMVDYRPGMMRPGIAINTSGEDFYPIDQIQLVHFNGTYYETFGEVLRYDPLKDRQETP